MKTFINTHSHVCLPFILSLLCPSGSYSKRPQGENKHGVEDSGRKGSNSSTKVPPSPAISSERKKSSTPSTVSVCLFDMFLKDLFINFFFFLKTDKWTNLNSTLFCVIKLLN